MQYLDFSCGGDEEAVRAQIGQMRALRRLTDEQAAAADICAIVRFLQSPLAARIRASRKVEREYRFSLLRPARELTGADSDDPVLLQGVVDCFFEEDGALVVVDFKTDRIAPGETEARVARYRAQLEAYSIALSRVMEKPVREKILYFFAPGEEVRI